jgi:hypothetical protein
MDYEVLSRLNWEILGGSPSSMHSKSHLFPSENIKTNKNILFLKYLSTSDIIPILTAIFLGQSDA